MRRVMIVLGLVGSGCVLDSDPPAPLPPLLAVEVRGTEPCATGGNDFVGAELGCTVVLDASLDPARVEDPTGWTVDVLHTPRTVYPLDSGTARISLAITDSLSDWRVTKNIYTQLWIRDASGTRVEEQWWDAALVDPTRAPARAWLWDSFWTSYDRRVKSNNEPVDCRELAIVTYLGGDLSRVSRIEIDVFDDDVIGSEPIGSHQLALDGGRRYELEPTGICAWERHGNISTHADPVFTTRLVDVDGNVIDTREGLVLTTR